MFGPNAPSVAEMKVIYSLVSISVTYDNEARKMYLFSEVSVDTDAF